jgi:hypothetical protein
MSGPAKPQKLLAADALKGVRIALSASESADFERLGLLDTHFRLALGEIARSVLVGSGKLAYGGHLDPSGYTTYLVKELHRYSRRDQPLLICLPWSEHRRVDLSFLAKQKDELGLFGEIVCLDPEGKQVKPEARRTEAASPEADADIRRRGLSAMREHVAAKCDGLVVLGGKKSGFQGRMPGILEEVLCFLQAKKPVYLAGGYGGAALEAARRIDVASAKWLPVIASETVDHRLTQALVEIKSVLAGRGWAALDNGLTDDENRRLAATPRPSDVASLVSLGLGRRFS